MCSGHFLVGKLFMVVFGAMREKKGPVDRCFNRDSSDESKSRFVSKGNSNYP
jgi:hypothetical protein